MNQGVLVCLMFAILFFIFTVLFAVLKEKGAMLVSGFNTLPKAERVHYDHARISKDMRNFLFLCTGTFVLGAVCSYLISSYLAVVTILIWIVLMAKNTRLDAKKAFQKYRQSN